jgi:hypothetical protein
MEKGPFNPKDKRVSSLTSSATSTARSAASRAMEILTPIVNAPDWERIPDFAKAAIYKGVIEATRREGAQARCRPDSARARGAAPEDRRPRRLTGACRSSASRRRTWWTTASRSRRTSRNGTALPSRRPGHGRHPRREREEHQQRRGRYAWRRRRHPDLRLELRHDDARRADHHRRDDAHRQRRAVDGLTISAPSTGNRAGLDIAGNGTGAALKLVGGATGVGISVAGGGTSGDGIKVTTTSGHGVNLAPVGTSMHGLFATGGNGGTSDGIKAAAGTGGVDLRARSPATSPAIVRHEPPCFLHGRRSRRSSDGGRDWRHGNSCRQHGFHRLGRRHPA